MAGIARETAMRELCQRDPTIQPDECSQSSEGVNMALYKAGAYNRSTQNKITSWLSLHKKASNAEPDQITPKDGSGMLQGVAHFIADYLR